MVVVIDSGGGFDECECCWVFSCIVGFFLLLLDLMSAGVVGFVTNVVVMVVVGGRGFAIMVVINGGSRFD